MVSSASRVARVTALLTYSLVLLVTDLPTCSTHAGLYSSSQVIAIVVKAGDSSGRKGVHVGLKTFSGKALSRLEPHLAFGITISSHLVRVRVRVRVKVRVGVGDGARVGTTHLELFVRVGLELAVAVQLRHTHRLLGRTW